MAIKYDKCLSKEYLSIKNHLGEVQCAVLECFIKHDKERESISFWDIHREVPNLISKYSSSSKPSKYRWHDSWGAIRRLYKRGILCKVVIGEDTIIRSKLPKNKLKNRAWFVFTNNTKMDPTYTISPFIDIHMVTLIIEHRLNTIVNRLTNVYSLGYKF